MVKIYRRLQRFVDGAANRALVRVDQAALLDAPVEYRRLVDASVGTAVPDVADLATETDVVQFRHFGVETTPVVLRDALVGNDARAFQNVGTDAVDKLDRR